MQSTKSAAALRLQVAAATSAVEDRDVRASNAELRQRARVVVGVRLALQLGERSARGSRRRDSCTGRARRRRRSSCALRAAAAESARGPACRARRPGRNIDAIEKPQRAGCVEGICAELLFDLEPHRHRIDADVLAGQARQEQFAPVLAFESATRKRVRDLEPSLVIDSRRRVAPEHAQLLHFAPQISTAIVGDGSLACQRQKLASVSYAYNVTPLFRPNAEGVSTFRLRRWASGEFAKRACDTMHGILPHASGRAHRLPLHAASPPSSSS